MFPSLIELPKAERIRILLLNIDSVHGFDISFVMKSTSKKQKMIDKSNSKISITKKCKLLKATELLSSVSLLKYQI